MASPQLTVHTNQSIRMGTYASVPIREDTLFTDHAGDEKKGIRKRAEKTLDEHQELLRRLLEREETVLYVARAQAPVGLLEQVTFGWYTYYVTSVVLVVTNRRLLHLLVTRDGKWKKSLRAVRWGDLTEAQVKSWLSPTLELVYRSDKKEKYWGLRREDAKKLKLLVSALLPASTGEATAAQGAASLCPRCFVGLTLGLYQCPKCNLTFKDEKTMVQRSLLIPGGGYFYTRQWFLAIGDFIAEAVILWLLIVSVALVIGVVKPPPAAPGEAAPLAANLAVVGIVGGILAVEKWFTIRHCRRFIREYIPQETL